LEEFLDNFFTAKRKHGHETNQHNVHSFTHKTLAMKQKKNQINFQTCSMTKEI